MRRTDLWEKTLVVGKIEAGREGDDRGWEDWMASPTRWTWVWVSSGNWWWTGKPGMLHSVGVTKSRTLLNDGTDWCIREERKKPKSREHQQFLRLHGKLLVRVMHMLVTLELFSLRSSFPLLLGVMAHCCFYLVCGLGIYWNVNKGIIILKTNYLINHCLNFYAL